MSPEQWAAAGLTVALGIVSWLAHRVVMHSDERITSLKEVIEHLKTKLSALEKAHHRLEVRFERLDATSMHMAPRATKWIEEDNS
jgi:predicted RNase H-like nuclease (RuvC/YqgF family)